VYSSFFCYPGIPRLESGVGRSRAVFGLVDWRGWLGVVRVFIDVYSGER
jgi:hypothetical protein